MLQIIEDRRALHQIPELDRQLPETLAYLTGCPGPAALPPAAAHGGGTVRVF